MNSLTAHILRRLALLLAVGLLGMFVWGGNQPEAAGLIDPPWDKLAHLTWFAVLAGLLRMGLGRRWSMGVVVFCLAVGLWDEWRQLSLPGRAAGWDDLLFDCLGVALGVWLADNGCKWVYYWIYDSRRHSPDHYRGSQPDCQDR
jgi:VanZ family protein